MKLKNSLKFVLSFLVAISVKYSSAQNFENYSQELKGASFFIEMIAVEGGSFIMGVANDNPYRSENEKPGHEVLVDDFWMGTYEISWEQYDAFIYADFEADQFQKKEVLTNMGIDAVTGATSPYEDMSDGMGKGSSPAVNMTQYAAIMFCKWLSAKTGVFFRLPTEAEWEYACKKGKTDDVENLDDYGIYKANSNKKYMETGSKTPNTLGIYDMLGNVSEWVLDQYSTDYYAISPKENPWNVPSKLYPRVVRGGSWKDTASKLCCTSRQRSRPNWKVRDPQIPKSNWWHTDASFIGFRVVRPKIQPGKQQIEAYWLNAIEDYGLN
jgi:formylglycine-generating enzyme required for sulfatase activity